LAAGLVTWRPALDLRQGRGDDGLWRRDGEEYSGVGDEGLVGWEVPSDEEKEGRATSLSTGERKETWTELEEEGRERGGSIISGLLYGRVLYP